MPQLYIEFQVYKVMGATSKYNNMQITQTDESCVSLFSLRYTYIIMRDKHILFDKPSG